MCLLISHFFLFKFFALTFALPIYALTFLERLKILQRYPGTLGNLKVTLVLAAFCTPLLFNI